MIISTRMTVGTAAVQLVPSHNQPQSVKFVNAGTVVVRIGADENVSSTLAFGLAALPNTPNVTRNIWEFDLNPGEEIWGITASGSAAVNVWIQQK